MISVLVKPHAANTAVIEQFSWDQISNSRYGQITNIR